MVKKAAWFSVMILVVLASGVGACWAEKAILFEAPSESTGLAAIAAPMGGRAWILETAEKKLACLKASDGLGRAMTFPAGTTLTLAVGSDLLDAPTNQTATPASQTVPPSMNTISAAERDGWHEFTHHLTDSENLAYTKTGSIHPPTPSPPSI